MQMNIMQEQKTTHMTPAESPRSERRCYTVEEVMEFLGVGRKAVYSLIHKKAFPAIRISNLGYRIPKESFNFWLLQKWSSRARKLIDSLKLLRALCYHLF